MKINRKKVYEREEMLEAFLGGMIAGAFICLILVLLQ